MPPPDTFQCHFVLKSRIPVTDFVVLPFGRIFEVLESLMFKVEYYSSRVKSLWAINNFQILRTLNFKP